jgi:ribosomal protein S18 acetylase RimI-like enzyme
MPVIDPEQLSVRPALREDAEFVFSLHEKTMREYVIATFRAWDAGWQRKRFDQRYAPSNVRVLRYRRRDVGILWTEEKDRTLVLSNIQVLPEFQRQGIGTAAVRLVLAEASARGMGVALQVLRVNPARRLYERLGFRVTGETETHVLMQFAAP